MNNEYPTAEKKLKPIGYLCASVRVPLFEGDKTERNQGAFDWFEYSEPGITEDGHIATCRRKAELIAAQVVLTVDADE